MAKNNASELDFAGNFLDRVTKLLHKKEDYEMFFRVICQYQQGYISLRSFHEKIKYIFRHHPSLIAEFNPMLPDSDQFTEEELREKRKKYKDLKVYKKGIDFINTLKERVKDPKQFKDVCELVKRFSGNEIDESDFYGKVYENMQGDFKAMLPLARMLGRSDGVSYIEVPGQHESSEKVLNTRFRSGWTERGAPCKQRLAVPNIDVNYLYKVDLVMEEANAVFKFKSCEDEIIWYEDRLCELDQLLAMFKCAEKYMSKVCEKLKERKIENWNEFDLRKYLVQKKVRVKLVESICGNIESLKLNDGRRLKVGLKNMEEKKAEVDTARQELINKLR